MIRNNRIINYFDNVTLLAWMESLKVPKG